MSLHRTHMLFMNTARSWRRAPGRKTLLVALFLTLPCAALGQVETPAPAPADPPAQTLEQIFAGMDQEPFVYRREGRPDPFFPFLTQEILRAETRAREELPGMQRFEPGQLTLVAIIFAAREPLAMVQDSAGIGYVLKKGTQVGQSGKVVAIDRNKVVIEQAVSIPGSEQKTRKIEMILKREGEI